MKHKSKLKQCKSCGAEIAKSAKNCPQCGAKNKKPVYKRVWFILLCIIAVFIIIGALSGNDEKAKSDTTGNKQVEEETTSLNTTRQMRRTAEIDGSKRVIT